MKLESDFVKGIHSLMTKFGTGMWKTFFVEETKNGASRSANEIYE